MCNTTTLNSTSPEIVSKMMVGDALVPSSDTREEDQVQVSPSHQASPAPVPAVPAHAVQVAHNPTLNPQSQYNPKLTSLTPLQFRHKVRSNQFTSPTNGMCPGHLQCNLVVLEQGPGTLACDFLEFCRRNPKACPLIEVLEVGSWRPSMMVCGDGDGDLRSDLPKYSIYRHGKFEQELSNVKHLWPSNSIAFLIGCSFTCDKALMDANIPLRSHSQKKNVPMYKTSIPCIPSGSLKGNMVVSMRPIQAVDVSQVVEITSKYPHGHGSPICVGCPSSIGIANVMEPDWGDAVEIKEGEVPVFWACGVTPQNILMESKVEFAITHSAGHMFVTDLESHVIPGSK